MHPQITVDEFNALLRGERTQIRRPADRVDPLLVVFPGAFAPVHEGHRQIARLAHRRLGHDAFFELSITNVDKPPLDHAILEARLRDLAGQPVVVTAAATFAEKARLFPGTTFVVGADTILRLADPCYCDHDPHEFTRQLNVIRSHQCRFLVFGRRVEGEFRTLPDMELPEPLRSISDFVSGEEFRVDISSSALRRQRRESETR